MEDHGRRRDFDGRFAGRRVNVEDVPRLPAFPARWVLADPRRRPYLVFWTREYGGIPYALKMEPSDRKDTVLVSIPDGQTFRVSVVRRRLPRGTGQALFYRCPRCRRPCRYLYPLVLVGDQLVAYLGLRCQPCAGLRFASQGLYRGQIERGLIFLASGGARTVEPKPRYPRDPRAVSDPRLVAEELSH